MNNDKNVIHLADYITQEAKIEDFDISKPLPQLGHPDSLLIKRGAALALDFSIVLTFNAALHTSFAVFVNEFFAPFSNTFKAGLTTPNMAYYASIFMVLFAGYFLVSALILDGGSIGKKVMGLKVINENFTNSHIDQNHELNFMQALQRSLGYVLCYLSFGTFFIFHFSSEDRRGLSDYLSNSRTVTDSWLKLMLEHKEYAAHVVTIDINSLNEAA